jgi:hypothetical protein
MQLQVTGQAYVRVVWIVKAVSVRLKRPELEATAKVNNAWRYTSAPHYAFMK